MGISTANGTVTYVVVEAENKMENDDDDVGVGVSMTENENENDQRAYEAENDLESEDVRYAEVEEIASAENPQNAYWWCP